MKLKGKHLDEQILEVDLVLKTCKNASYYSFFFGQIKKMFSFNFSSFTRAKWKTMKREKNDFSLFI